MGAYSLAESHAHSSRVIAIMSSFNPSPALIANCLALRQQVTKIIVVDDGSIDSDAVLDELETLSIIVVRLGENLGIGHAMNTGFAIARQFRPEFIVTFDQDSAVPEGFVTALVDEYDRVSELGVGRVGMLVPEFFSATRQTSAAANTTYLESDAPIQSGMLLPLDVIDELGDQRADFFIDLIDTEYYFRAKRAGFITVCAPQLVLPHSLGHRLYVHAFGRRLKKTNGQTRVVSVSTPFRYYYRARNRIFLNHEFKHVKDIRGVLRRQTRNDLLVDFVVALCSSKGKSSLLRIVLAGWRDGFRGTAGKIPPKIATLSSRVSWRNPVNLD